MPFPAGFSWPERDAWPDFLVLSGKEVSCEEGFGDSWRMRDFEESIPIDGVTFADWVVWLVSSARGIRTSKICIKEQHVKEF